MIRQTQGYTMIELMITVVIVAILASMAFPTYQDSVANSRRARAMATLESIAAGMERFYVSSGTYAGATGEGDVPEDFIYNLETEDAAEHYLFTATDLNDRRYNLFATPREGSTQEGTGGLTLTSTGIRGWDEDGDGGNGYETTW